MVPGLSSGAAVGLRQCGVPLQTPRIILCPAMGSPSAYPGIRISGCWALGAEGR